jgi:hypothetical protein
LVVKELLLGLVMWVQLLRVAFSLVIKELLLGVVASSESSFFLVVKELFLGLVYVGPTPERSFFFGCKKSFFWE